ncbi:MAG: hypothetical protein PHE29_08215 [Tissierellia bacterium]|nr:hypothetical protein [Tissierellia bacterium]MDD4779049.1 hypothetical protein [Tissierellia bacterium]
MNWEWIRPNKETFIINLMLILASIIAMISAVKLSSYSLGTLSILLSAVKVKIKSKY